MKIQIADLEPKGCIKAFRALPVRRTASAKSVSPL